LVFDSLTAIIVSSAGGFFRFRNLTKFTKNGLMKKVYSKLYSSYLEKNCSFIGLEVTFKNEPCFPHGIKGVFISNGAIIGKDCVIFQNVVIGSNTLPDSKSIGFPVVGDHCFMGAGATIVGKVVIGDNCRIGANVTITKDLPSNSVAVNAPPRIFQRDKLDNKFYSFRNNKWQVNKSGKFIAVSDKLTLDKLNSVKRETG
jgi:serine O-acetyltransferase